MFCVYLKSTDMLADGEIDHLKCQLYTGKSRIYRLFNHAEGTERYWIYTREIHADLAGW